MIFMRFMKFGSDILVFICMCFVLVDLFDEWVYGCINGGYLRFICGANLDVLSYNM